MRTTNPLILVMILATCNGCAGFNAYTKSEKGDRSHGSNAKGGSDAQTVPGGPKSANPESGAIRVSETGPGSFNILGITNLSYAGGSAISKGRFLASDFETWQNGSSQIEIAWETSDNADSYRLNIFDGAKGSTCTGTPVQTADVAATEHAVTLSNKVKPLVCVEAVSAQDSLSRPAENNQFVQKK